MLLYEGSDAMHIISSMPKQINRALRNDVRNRNDRNNEKHKTVFNNEHDFVYYPKCLEKSSPHENVGESGRRLL